MDSKHSMATVRRDRSRPSAFRRRALEASYWALATVVLAAYCGARSYRDLEPRYATDHAGSAFVPAAPTGNEGNVTTAAGRAGSRE